MGYLTKPQKEKNMFKLMDDENEGLVIKDWPVVISVPQDGGAVAKHEIRADFLLLPQDEIDAQMELSRESDGYVDRDILRRVVKRLSGVADAEGKALDYTPDLLEKMIKKPFVRNAMISTYFEAAAGKKAKRKN